MYALCSQFYWIRTVFRLASVLFLFASCSLCLAEHSNEPNRSRKTSDLENAERLGENKNAEVVAVTWAPYDNRADFTRNTTLMQQVFCKSNNPIKFFQVKNENTDYFSVNTFAPLRIAEESRKLETTGKSYQHILQKALNRLSGAKEPTLVLALDSHGTKGFLCRQFQNEVSFDSFLGLLFESLDSFKKRTGKDVHIGLFGNLCHVGSIQKALEKRAVDVDSAPFRSGEKGYPYKIDFYGSATANRLAYEVGPVGMWQTMDRINQLPSLKMLGNPQGGRALQRYEAAFCSLDALNEHLILSTWRTVTSEDTPLERETLDGLSSKDSPLQLEAVIALAKKGGNFKETAKHWPDDATPEHASGFATAVAKHKGPEALKFVEDVLLAHPNPEIRLRGALTLGYFNREDIGSAFSKALGDSSAKVRQAAVKSTAPKGPFDKQIPVSWDDFIKNPVQADTPEGREWLEGRYKYLTDERVRTLIHRWMKLNDKATLKHINTIVSKIPEPFKNDEEVWKFLKTTVLAGHSEVYEAIRALISAEGEPAAIRVITWMKGQSENNRKGVWEIFKTLTTRKEWPKFFDALLTALSETKSQEVQNSIVSRVANFPALGGRRFAALLDIAKNKDFPDVVRKKAAYLFDWVDEELNGREVKTLIATAQKIKASDVRRAILTSAIRYLKHLDDSDMPDSLDSLVKLFENDESPEVRAAALAGMYKIRKDALTPRLLELASKGDDPVSFMAAQLSYVADPTRGESRLIHFLDSQDSSQIIRAMNRLQKNQNPEIVSAVLAKIESPNLEVSQAAVWSIPAMIEHHPNAEDLFERLLRLRGKTTSQVTSDRDAYLNRAKDALNEAVKSNTWFFIKSFQDSKDPLVRLGAIKYLDATGFTEIDILGKALRDPDARVRQMAATKMQFIQDSSWQDHAVELLKKSLLNPVPGKGAESDQISIAQNLGRMQGDSGFLKGARDTLRDALTRADLLPPRVRAQVVSSMAEARAHYMRSAFRPAPKYSSDFDRKAVFSEYLRKEPKTTLASINALISMGPPSLEVVSQWNRDLAEGSKQLSRESRKRLVEYLAKLQTPYVLSGLRVATKDSDAEIREIATAAIVTLQGSLR